MLSDITQPAVILFDQAEGIDFLNSNKTDNAFADSSFWEFLAQLDHLAASSRAFPASVLPTSSLILWPLCHLP